MKNLIKVDSASILKKELRNKPGHVMKLAVPALEQAESNVKIMTQAYMGALKEVSELTAKVEELELELTELKEGNNETDSGEE